MDVQLGGFASSVFSFSSTAREPARLPQGAYIRPSYHQQGVWSTTVLTHRSTPRRGRKLRRPPEPQSHRDHQVQRPGQTLTSQVTLLTFAQTMSSPPVLSPTGSTQKRLLDLHNSSVHQANVSQALGHQFITPQDYMEVHQDTQPPDCSARHDVTSE